MKNILYNGFKYFLALFLFFAGSAHFIKTEFYIKMLPDYLPYPVLLVYLSGFIMMVLSQLFLYHKTQKFAAYGIILLFIAVFPANLNMYFHYEDFTSFTEQELFVRLFLQIPLIFWVYFYIK